MVMLSMVAAVAEAVGSGVPEVGSGAPKGRSARPGRGCGDSSRRQAGALAAAALPAVRRGDARPAWDARRWRPRPDPAALVADLRRRRL